MHIFTDSYAFKNTHPVQSKAVASIVKPIKVDWFPQEEDRH